LSKYQLSFAIIQHNWHPLAEFQQ